MDLEPIEINPEKLVRFLFGQIFQTMFECNATTTDTEID